MLVPRPRRGRGRPRKRQITLEESAFLSEQSNPKDATEALSCPGREKWKAAMLQEYHALDKNETWTLVDRPTNAEIIKTK